MPRHQPETLRRARRIARLAGAVAGLIGGVLYAVYIIPNSPGNIGGRTETLLAALLAAGAVGMAWGFLAAPLISVEPFLWLERTLDTAAPGQLAGGAVGLIVALVISVLVTLLLSGLPAGIGYIVSLAFAGVLVYVCVNAGMRRQREWLALAGEITGRGAVTTVAAEGLLTPAPVDGPPVVVDTSVLIDGRIVDVARSGFLPGRLVIADFVLEELQRVADAGEPMRRARGKRGLSVVEELTASPDVVVEVATGEPSHQDVDIRLLRLARARAAAVMTTDFNLNRLAQIEGLRVLNLNDLANALKPIVSAGETMDVTIVKEGKELHQGVGYLEDGTMVVVENARRHLDETVHATVTSVLQTPAGRMIFATLPDEGRRREPRGGRTRMAGR